MVGKMFLPQYCIYSMYDESELMREIYDGVTFKKGYGETGKRVVVLDKDCEKCSHDRQLCVEEVNVEMENSYEYYCLSPNCPDFVGDELSYLFDR